MNRPEGRPPKPVEVKRRLGNPGKRPLPPAGTLAVLPGSTEPPEPPRPLQRDGLAMWVRVWEGGALWLARTTDIEAVLLLCEAIDERERLRALAHAVPFDRFILSALRAIESQIWGGLSALGFTPTDRARLNVAEVRPEPKAGIESILGRSG